MPDVRLLPFATLSGAGNMAADEAMRVFTSEMIDAALDCDGRYYLPYRLHASAEQFNRAYPRAEEFFAKKRHHDPAGIFRNQFYLKYGLK